MKRPLIFLGLALALHGAQAADWSSWWRTPDQQGDALLKAGNPKEAARTYTDPQRKGYAQLQGGNYAEAARDYAAATTADAHYNRGNALAHSGDLAGAVKAYDAALAREPQHRDALHNRALVQKALDQKQQQKQDQKQDQKQGQKPDQKQDQKQDPKQGQKQDQKQPGQQDGQKPGQQDGQKPGQQDPKQDGQKPGQQDQQKPGQQQGQQKRPAGDQGKDGKEPGQQSGGDDKQQAQKDVADSLGKNTPAQPPGAKPGDRIPVDPRAEEKRVSEQQWLRAIPDDPGGLLRRKLLIEHMIRQQEQQR